MAARKTPGSPKPDKLMRDALLIELMVETSDDDGKLAKRLRKVARALVTKAEAGDVAAIKEIADRTDGKSPQALDLNHGVQDTLGDLLRDISGKSRGIPKG